MVTWINKSFPFAAGVSNKHNDQSVPVGKLEVLENGQFDELGSIGKRNGYAAHTTTIQNGSDTSGDTPLLVNPTSVFAANNNLFVSGWRQDTTDATTTNYDGPKLLRYDSSLDTLIDKGNFLPCQISSEQVGNDGTFLSADYAESDNAIGVMVRDFSAVSSVLAGTHYAILDKETSNIIRHYEFLANIATNTFFRVIGLPSALRFLYSTPSTNDIKSALWSDSSPLDAITPTNLITDLHADDLWDTYVDASNNFYIVYKQTGGNLFMNYYNTAGTLQSGLDLGVVAKEFVTIGKADTAGEPNQSCIFYKDNTTSNLDAITYDNGSIVAGPFTISTAFTASLVITATCTSTSQRRLHFFVESVLSSVRTIDAISSSYAGASILLTDTLTNGQMVLSSRAFSAQLGADAGNNELPLVWISHDTTEQGCKFLCSPRTWWDDTDTNNNEGMNVFAKVNYQKDATSRSGYQLPQVQLTDTNKYTTVALTESNSSGLGFLRNKPELVTVELNTSVQRVSIDDGVLVNGGFISGITDTALEEQPLLYPEDLTLTETLTGGSVQPGAYSISALYEWRDSHGNFHRSAPSSASTITTTGVDSRITVVIPNSPLYTRSKGGSLTSIAVYRTETNGSILYKDKEVAQGTTTESSIVLSASNTALSDNALLYTTGGRLSNISPPPSRYLWKNHNRIFSISADEESIWYSLIGVKGLAWEFNPFHKIATDSIAVGGANMDGRQVVFFENSVSWFSGDGPSDTGVGAFSPLVELPYSIGCSEANSIVSIDDGVVFKSVRGFYLLTRSLELTPIGLDVEDFDQYSVVSASVKSDKWEVRFSLSNGNLLVWNWLLKQWSVHTSAWGNALGTNEVVDTESFTDLTYVLNKYTTTNQVFLNKEDEAVFSDAGSAATSLKVVTGWIPLTDNKSGWVRVRRLSLLGEKKSDHTLTINIYQDYNDTTPTQTETVDTSTLSDPHLFRIRLNKQKCSAIKVEISDAGTGENYSLTEMVLEVGTKKGINKTDNSNTF